jgi:hypothetical protein
LPYVPDAKAFGAIALAARRRYRGGIGFDASLYGAKVRKLIDDHVEALGIEQKIPPVSITAADFDAKVGDVPAARRKRARHGHPALCHHGGQGERLRSSHREGNGPTRCVGELEHQLDRAAPQELREC